MRRILYNMALALNSLTIMVQQLAMLDGEPDTAKPQTHSGTRHVPGRNDREIIDTLLAEVAINNPLDLPRHDW